MSISFDGIASGMNTSELVQQLIQIERRPITLMQQRVQAYQQRMDAWRDVNMRLSSLETKLSDLLLSSAYEARKATSSEPDVASATAKNSAVDGSYEIEVLQLATAQRVASKRFGPDTPNPISSEGSFTINDATITVDSGDTLQSIATKLNESEAGVIATVIDNHLVIENKATGVELTWSDDDGILHDLGILQSGEANELQPAQTAKLIVNGIEITGQTTNTVEVVEGVSFTLKATGTTVISVAKDVDGTVAKIKDFVDQLNSTMDFISTRLAKDGILQGDSALVRLQTSLRMALMDRVETGGSLTSLSSIGITFTREGRAELDETKLREALGEDSQAVYKLLAMDGGDEGSGDAKPLGAARRARDLIRAYTQTGGVISGRREMFEEQIASTKASIERLEERLERQEERLYRQFGAMEQALAALQTQSAWLQTQLVQLAMVAPSR